MRRKKERAEKKAKRTLMAGRVKESADNRDSKTQTYKVIQLPDDVRFFTSRKGIVHLNVIPYKVSSANHPEQIKKGDYWWRRKIKTHRGVGIENRVYVCPKSISEPCPICDHLAPLYKDYETNRKAITQYRAKDRDLINVVDLDDEAAGAQIWDVSYHLFANKLFEEISEGDEDWARFAEPEDGYTLKIRFAEKTLGGDRPFFEAARIDFVEREDYEQDLISQAVPLDDLLVVLPYKELEEVFLGVDLEQEEEEEEKEYTEPKRTKQLKKEEHDEPKRTKQLKEEKDDEDWDDDEEWDDGEE